MNENQYRSLCDVCDQMLLEPGSTMARVSIPWLHVIREHPVFLAAYEDLFKPSGGGDAFSSRFVRIMRNHAAWLRQVIWALRSNGAFWFEVKELPNGIDVLFVSHLLTEEQATRSDDFYFGDLPEKLAAQGQSVVIALINHTDVSSAKLVVKFGASPVRRIVLAESLGYPDELMLHRCLCKESLHLSKLARLEPLGLKRSILARASDEARGNPARMTMRLGKQIGALVAKLKPKAVIVTHEGHAWERLAFAAARNSSANVRCIGYQHAALFRMQHAIKRRLATEYNPDQVLTAGRVAKAQLDREPDLAGISISVLGSNRAIRADPPRMGEGLRNIDQSRIAARTACLVVPEGIPSECHLLFAFALECAKLCPAMDFIWRLHPLITFKNLADNNSKLRRLPANITVSKLSLGDDMAKCQWVLYRGSTAAIQAVAKGLRPVYLKVGNELTIDPLYEIGHPKVLVETPENFFDEIKKNKGLSSNEYLTGMDAIKKYCNECYTPFDYKLITELNNCKNRRGIV